MLLETYTKKIIRAECNPGFQAVHLIASLDQDVGQALPYLNAALGGFEYFKNPPGVTFKVNGRLITVESRQIAVNALKDEAEADRILEWLKREINDAWENRHTITPSEAGMPKPNMVALLKHLPKENCRECGAPTCMVFALRLMEGAKSVKDCPRLAPAAQQQLESYLDGFHLEDW